MERDKIIKALECCTRGRKSKDDRPCLDCPYNECNLVGGTSERQTTGTCQGWLMKDALALIKELTAENKQFRYEQRKLIEERDTFREYAYNMQKYVESINHKEEEGYEPSAARYAAEMEMWHRVALQTKRLEDENAEQEKAIINALDRMGEIRRETNLDTVRKMQEKIKAFFDGETDYQRCSHGYIHYAVDQIAKEMLEGEK